MRIAIYHNLPSGGAKRALFEWTRQLADSHAIDVYTLSTADHHFCDIRSFVKNYYIFNFTPRRLFNSPFGRLNQLQRWLDLHTLDRLNHRIAGQINSANYDVLFAHPGKFTLIPPLLTYVNIPMIDYLHEPFGQDIVQQVRRPNTVGRGWREKLDRIDPLISLYQHRLEKMRKRSIHKVDLLLSNSEFTRGVIHEKYKVDASICHCGVNPDDFWPMPDVTRENFVLSVGELTPRKGFDFLVNSLSHIPAEKRPILKLACNVVDQQERKFLQELANQNGVDIEIQTGLNVDELRFLYNKARLCVYSPVLEPFGLVPLEAMACGTAVIGIREGGVVESVVHERTGLLINRNAVEFGQAILRLLENPVLAEQFGKNGRKYILENWTWKKSTVELERYLYKVALNGTEKLRKLSQLTYVFLVWAIRYSFSMHIHWMARSLLRK